jgi:hypothetical protein
VLLAEATQARRDLVRRILTRPEITFPDVPPPVEGRLN